MFLKCKINWSRARIIGVALVVVYFSLVTFVSIASPTIPNSPQTSVAKWTVLKNEPQQTVNLERIAWHIDQGQYPGMAGVHYNRAAQLLDAIEPSKVDSATYWYLRGRVLQHQHHFDQALNALDKALTLDPKLNSATLLKASIELVQGNTELAKQTCMSLLGKTNIDVTTGCLLETASYADKLPQSYEQLKRLLSSLSKEAEQRSATDNWLVQMAADMALRLNKPEDAAQWLAVSDLRNMPLSYVALWADAQRQLGHHSIVLNTLSNIVESLNFKDDTLLVRLAMAEKSLNEKFLNTQADKQYWQQEIAKRITLRVERKDTFHAADLARYFIYIDPQPEKARQWALLNYQQAKLYEDYALLQTAIQMPVSDSV